MTRTRPGSFGAALAVALACLAVSTLVACERNRPPDDRPNIILVIGDDHGYPYYGFMGDDVVQTPELDRLAAHGTTFTNAHSTASSCRPALNTLLTGLHPLQWRAELRALRSRGLSFEPNTAIEHVDTLPRMLARAGYASFQAGKHWEGPYRLAGFTGGMAHEELPDKVMSPSVYELGRKTNQPVYDFIDANADRPFFLWYAPLLPHVPLDPPAAHRAPYEGKGLSEEAIGYFGNIAWFDTVTRDLLDYVDQKGLRERTLVIYLSDNGWEQPRETESGSPIGGAHGKLSMFPLGFRTPIIFSWPGHVPEERRIDARASLVDVVPTLVDFAGLEPPARLPGRSLRPAIEGKPWKGRAQSVGSMDVVRWSDDRPRQAGARFGNHERAYYVNGPRWHYVWYRDRDVEELYDTSVDFAFERNVAASHPDVTARLKKHVRLWKYGLETPWRTKPEPERDREDAPAP